MTFEWKPVPIYFSDEEIIRALMTIPDDEKLRVGNLWTKYRGLPKKEQADLAAEARARKCLQE